MNHKKRAVLCMALLLCAPSVCLPQPAGPPPGLNRSEYAWALDWINRELDRLMGTGVFQKIVVQDTVWVIHAGKAWYQLSLDQQARTMQELSRAREITGHSPAATVLDESGQGKLAEVTMFGVQLFVPGEGLVPYAAQQAPEQSTPVESR